MAANGRYWVQVFARDVGTAPPAELLKVAAVNVPVKLQTDEQDMEIRPGDYLIADVNGVVVLPIELAEKALPLMQKQVQVRFYSSLKFSFFHCACKIVVSC